MSKFHLFENTIPSLDLAGNTRVYGASIDMGAYEYSASTASVSEVSTVSYKVFPNPATTTIQVSGSTDTATLYNLAVNNVLIQNLNQSNRTDVLALSIGMYMLKVDGVMVKVIKE